MNTYIYIHMYIYIYTHVYIYIYVYMFGVDFRGGYIATYAPPRIGGPPHNPAHLPTGAKSGTALHWPGCGCLRVQVGRMSVERLVGLKQWVVADYYYLNPPKPTFL